MATCFGRGIGVVTAPVKGGPSWWGPDVGGSVRYFGSGAPGKRCSVLRESSFSWKAGWQTADEPADDPPQPAPTVRATAHPTSPTRKRRMGHPGWWRAGGQFGRIHASASVHSLHHVPVPNRAAIDRCKRPAETRPGGARG